jgi:hypothetical protein
MEIIPVKIIPINNNLNNNLKNRDEQFIQLLGEIEYKKKMLLDKQHKMKQISDQNEIFENIKHDYSNYYSYITKQKQDQVEALHSLHKYIKELTISGNLSKHNISDAKLEQKKIIQEIDSIKKNLDELVKNTTF